MTRFMLLLVCLLACALVSVPASADDPPKKLTFTERLELQTKGQELHMAGLKAYQAGKYADAIQSFEEEVKVARQLFNKVDFPDGHPILAGSLNNLANLYRLQGRFAAAEPLYKESLEMRKRLYKGQNHPDLASTLNNLAALYREQGKFADAEPLYKESLEMYRRLFKGDHLDLAIILNNLANLYQAQGKFAAAEPLYKESLEMRKRLCKGQDHPSVATSLNNLASLYQDQGKGADAEPLYKESLEMRKRLYKGQNHPDLAFSLNNLANMYQAQGKFADAEPLYKESLEMYRRLTVAFAQDKTEGETLTLLAQQPLTRDAFLSGARDHTADPAGVYAQVWADKGYVARAYERRQLQARAASADPKTAKVLAELTDARRRRAELLLAPAPSDPATLAKRNADIQAYGERIEAKTRELKVLLPVAARAEKLAGAQPAELQKVLPADTAVVDFLRFVHFEQDKNKAGNVGEKTTVRYLAFVVTKDKVAWVDLGTAANIETAVTAWRKAITSGEEIPTAIPAKVRELVWEPVRKQLPARIKTVYVCPDQALCKVPFAALPGDEPGTILLEDLALATIPHAPFLLDKLLPQDPLKNPPSGALVVGAVKYDADVTAAPGPSPAPGPLVKPGEQFDWSFLASTVGESNGIAAAAARKKLAATRLEGDKATTGAVLAALPKARYAHFATHGFFADESFRSVFQLDPKDYEQRGGERVGKAALSPLVMTGLVFAGANNPKTPARGVITGEQLIDLDLSGLELAVLSACETGLGDVAGGEGTFGLQRAFHYAGTKNVVCSLWAVLDEGTAAMMALFYRNLWEEDLTPMESLRQAQLEIYKNPQKIPELARGFRGKVEEVPGTGVEVATKPAKDGKAHPLLWAAFTLSGPGR